MHDRLLLVNRAQYQLFNKQNPKILTGLPTPRLLLAFFIAILGQLLDIHGINSIVVVIVTDKMVTFEPTDLEFVIEEVLTLVLARTNEEDTEVRVVWQYLELLYYLLEELTELFPVVVDCQVSKVDPALSSSTVQQL
jgi:hypothetical protein